MSQKVELMELESKVGTPIGLFVAMGSFESRCLTILSSLSKCAGSFLFFKNVQAGVLATDNLQKMKALTLGKSNCIDLDLDQPTKTADAIQSSLVYFRDAPEGAIFIDITTFTHEQLLIFVRVLHEAKIDRKIIFGYTGAEQYSTNTDVENVWLSKGVSQVRSILGFPGEFLPSRKLHLMLLVGFEHERAKAVIEQFEPAVLTLGIALSSQSVSDAHYLTNQKFFEQVKQFVDMRTSIYSEIRTFQFSGIDPMTTKQEVIDQVDKLPAFNTVVCPMNTKISTLGVGLAAIQNTSIQVCYARAITYNESGYSTPSKHATFFEVSFA